MLDVLAVRRAAGHGSMTDSKHEVGGAPGGDPVPVGADGCDLTVLMPCLHEAEEHPSVPSIKLAAMTCG